MSMTDGHIYFDVDMFAKGNRPAINPFVSVSRVGRQTQSPLRLSLNRELISFLTLHRKLESYSHFSAEAGSDVKRTLAVAERIFAFFTQSATEVKTIDLQIVVFCLLWADFWQDINKLEKDIATINEIYKNSLEAQEMVKELVASVNSLNELLQAVRKNQDKILKVLGVQLVQVTNI
jgi:F-type H+/Na+-transporting ATPase subunit alpha